MDGPRTRWLLAGTVTTLGVAVIWGLGASRQAGRTRELHRRHVGEQWDVARSCLTGGPRPRGEAVDALAARLAGQLYRAAARASEGDAPDALWPARCAGHVAALARGVPAGAAARELAALELACRRVLRPRAGRLTWPGHEGRLRSIAESIHALDDLMPPGVELGAEELAGELPGSAPADVAASHGCAGRPAPVRAAFPAPEGGAWAEELEAEDGGATTLRAEGAAVTVSTSGGVERAAAGEGLASPRLLGPARIVWLATDAPALVVEEVASGRRARRPLAAGRPGERLSTCGGRHVWVGRGGRLGWARLDDGEGPVRERPLPRAPPAGARGAVFCDRDRAVIAWRDGGRWRSVACGDGGCEQLPPVDAAGALRLAVLGDRILATHRAARADLDVGRVLGPEGWGPPFALARGALVARGGRFELRFCDALRVSADGARWAPATDGGRR